MGRQAMASSGVSWSEPHWNGLRPPPPGNGDNGNDDNGDDNDDTSTQNLMPGESKSKIQELYERSQM